MWVLFGFLQIDPEFAQCGRFLVCPMWVLFQRSRSAPFQVVDALRRQQQSADQNAFRFAAKAASLGVKVADELYQFGSHAASSMNPNRV